MSLFQCVYEIKRNTLGYWIFVFSIQSWPMLILSCPLFGIYFYLCWTYSESLTRVFFIRFGIYTYHVSEYHLSITANYICSRTLNEWFNLKVSKLGTAKESHNYRRLGQNWTGKTFIWRWLAKCNESTGKIPSNWANKFDWVSKFIQIQFSFNKTATINHSNR